MGMNAWRPMETGNPDVAGQAGLAEIQWYVFMILRSSWRTSSGHW
jgi:hypothetical protein